LQEIYLARELSLGTQTVVQSIFALIDVVSVNGAFRAAASQHGARTRGSPFCGLAAGPRFSFTEFEGQQH
jgi:hypothetical protein